MATTTQRALYVALLADLKTGISSVHNDYIYIVPKPIFAQNDSQYIQLIPGVPTSAADISGVGLIDETFSVAVWVRVDLDQAPHSTIRLTHATLGALGLCDDVRQALIQGGAGGLATTQITWINGSLPQEDDENPGWMFYEDTFKLQWEIAWS